MYYSFYLFLSILRCNVHSALVSDSNAYIWILNCIQLFKLYSNFQFVLYMTFQELQWHVVDDVDFNDAEADILEIVYKSQIPVLDGIE